MAKRIVIKVGSNVLTNEEGNLDTDIIQHLCEQMHRLKQAGWELILVSSGAVAAGRRRVRPAGKMDDISLRQLWSSVGQVRLLNTYSKEFEKYGLECAQVLVTREDFRDRKHFLNMKNCFVALLQNQVIPIVNENDVVSVTELMFTDNDELAAMVSAMTNPEQLIILSNVDGIYDGDPRLPGSRLIAVVDDSMGDLSEVVSA
ncbi:MAG: glutamate 5-kinase, partial [Cytophagales bacterium]|nr:glutamate 5-kinase [Cytophagales bacterium]